MTKTLRATPDGPAPAVPRPSSDTSPPVRIDVSGLTHPGLLRSNNEDQFFVSKLTRSLETMITSLPSGAVPERSDEVNHLMVVADGMGGHAAGEVASQMAISLLVSLALEVPDWFFMVDEEHAPEIERRAVRVIQQIGSELTRRGRGDARLRGMGSTLTGARSFGRDLLIAHVGDSRACLLRAGRLHRLTKDHTYAQALVDAGHLEASDVAASGVSHVLTNALGGSDEHVKVDVDLLRLEDGDRLLLCSDGLTDLVDDDAISKTLAAAPSSSEACSRLLQLALDGGGPDNITVIVAAYAFPEPPASPQKR